MYSEPSYDLSRLREALAAPTVGGFFCNGELAPIGVSGLGGGAGGAASTTTHLHGFTSVWAFVYDTRAAAEPEGRGGAESSEER